MRSKWPRLDPLLSAVPATQSPAAANPAAGFRDRMAPRNWQQREKYLNAGPGTARDSHQAAMLLWKAVAKQNLTATLLLSDLYLRGDGVSKSCDQARLLLDAAAERAQALLRNDCVTCSIRLPLARATDTAFLRQLPTGIQRLACAIHTTKPALPGSTGRACRR